MHRDRSTMLNPSATQNERVVGRAVFPYLFEPFCTKNRWQSSLVALGDAAATLTSLLVLVLVQVISGYWIILPSVLCNGTRERNINKRILHHRSLSCIKESVHELLV